MQSTSDWNALLEPFQSQFTRPGFALFRAFVLTLAHLDGRLWVTQVALTGLADRHFTCYYRFLKHGAWSPVTVCQQVWTLCVRRCADPNGRVFVACDDTVCAKSGQHFDAAGWHHDPMNKQSSKHLSFGHCFVCLAALGSQTAHHAVALFVSCALYVQQKVCEETKRSFATKLELAGKLYADLPTPEGLCVIATVDGAYAKKPFVQAVRAAKKHVLSRLRQDTVFYDLPPGRIRGQRGAPRKYGQWHKAKLWVEEEAPAWQRQTLILYGHATLLEYKTCLALQRTFGERIRLVAVRLNKDKPVVFLFCTDTSMTAEQIIVAYSQRFAIETGFRDAKQSFGFSTYQVRREEGIVRLAHLSLWAQTLLRLSAWNKKPEPIYGLWRKPLEYMTLPSVSIIGDTVHYTNSGPYRGWR
jgi:hypothetical protein